jgi:hypothetical protein
LGRFAALLVRQEPPLARDPNRISQNRFKSQARNTRFLRLVEREIPKLVAELNQILTTHTATRKGLAKFLSLLNPDLQPAA